MERDELEKAISLAERLEGNPSTLDKVDAAKLLREMVSTIEYLDEQWRYR